MHPCALLALHLHLVVRGTFTPWLLIMLGTPLREPLRVSLRFSGSRSRGSLRGLIEAGVALDRLAAADVPKLRQADQVGAADRLLGPARYGLGVDIIHVAAIQIGGVVARA